MTYKVDLDIYNGPMDLLLYLIRREEVDIREIPIARIADQYIAYLDLLKGLDIELAGDFVVMAATLLELKSRALLPRPTELEEGEAAEDLEDPRETLIRQLIEYRRFKEVAAMLQDRGREMAHRFPRQLDEDFLKQFGDEGDDVPSELLKGVEVWDLISAFSTCLRTLGYAQPREVIYDDTPVEEAAKRLLARIEQEKSLLFSQLFTAGQSPIYLITMFLAVLELVRQRRIGAEQEADFKDVRLFLRDPSKEEPPKPVTPKGARPSREALHRKGPRRPTSHQVESLREMMDDPQLEKTEFDEILDSIQVPEVETFRPIYSDEELLGRPSAEDEAAPADHAPGTSPDAPRAEAPTDAPAAGDAVEPPPESKGEPPA
jgi:segregation and condensation protein A